ncbi:MAG: LamG-like jellyroll fold domain-containing protein [Prosthecobacter sp.]|uniref:LamG-like jellyroll fold domain-containing protein n=1 Tax=Prosthecobacter sp. TaxID=1965333 RepID=UPI003900F287
MLRFFRRLLPCLLCFPWAASALQETWETGYTKDDATGAHVLGYWKFDEEAKDVTLHGAVLNPKGKFGGGLESFPGFPLQDKRHAALVEVKAVKGAFTLEMWIRPKAEFEAKLRCFLLDKKYVDHTDYQWQIGEADKGGLRRMWVVLGFGAESKTITSQPLKLTADAWQHVAFTYDGAGDGKFYLNGVAAGGMKLNGYGAVVPGTKPLSIGDRLGSNYGGFPGLIDEVRICEGVRSFEQVAMQIVSNRSVWRRMEPARPVEIVVTNLRRETMQAASLTLNCGGKEENFIVPDLAAGKSFTAKYTMNTALKPERYVMRARFSIGEYATEQTTEFEIVPRLAPRMPVVMWGANAEEMDRLKDIGFTHFIGLGADVGEIWTQKKAVPPGRLEVIERNRRHLDEALAKGLEVVASLSPASVLESDPKNLRVDRAGKPYARQDIAAAMPEFAPFFQNVGMSMAKTYGDHPAFTAALIDTEVRDHTAVSFNPVDVANYRKFSNAEIPAEVTAKWGVDWTKLKDFPGDRVIADDHPILKYLRWFWTVGDGWNNLHTSLSRGVKSGSKVWSFFDPAVRQPSISGAGGGVDVISHWTYTYPDPLKIGMCADQLFAMSAASGKNQRVMKMTQLIWYRSQTAPMEQKVPGDVVAWQDHDPEAAYITIAPMHLKEALWTKIARPIQGIMYHGWQSLVPTDSTSAYRYTNPNTAPVLQQLIHDVIVPLGPTLMAIPDERSEVALLESFTSQMFARRGSYGSNTDWAADVWLALQHAHVQTDILYEETLLKNGLSGRKVLVMPYCDVLTKSVVVRIADWQKKGGKIVADEFLCPGLKADFTIQSFKREKKAAEDKARVLELAKTLGGFALPQKAMCDNPEIIVRTRKFGDALYVFVVNDKREFGSYVGQHGLVMENGLPSSGVVSLKAESANVYELTGTQFIVPKRGEDGSLSWPVDLGPCDGKIFMITPKPLLGIKLEVPESAVVGNTAKITAQITTTQDVPTKAVIPVRVDIRDASGKSAEGSGFYAAENGIAELELNLAPNEDAGTWEVRVKELASGMVATKWMKITSK